MLSTLKYPTVSHLKSVIYIYIMALRNASTDHAYHRSYAQLFNYIYGHCIKLINTEVHNTILITKPYRAAVIEHNAGNYYSSIMLNRYQANSAKINIL